MIDTREAVDFIISEFNVSEFVGVPCSYLKNLINEVSRRGLYKSFFNEGDAVAYAVGRQIADPHTRVCILMQNSGIGNAVNPITSLSEIYQVPLLMIVGNRKPIPEEPQHSIMGEISKEMILMTMMETGGATIELNSGEDVVSLQHIPDEFKSDSIVYFVNDKDVFSEVDPPQKSESFETELTYEKVIDAFDELRSRGREFILVTTTGYTSRVAYKKDSPYNFYNVGAMGCAWSVANGLSYNEKGLPVICIDGDGSYFMRASSSKTFEGPSRCIRVILKNGSYRSTGGQSLQIGSPDEGLTSEIELRGLVTLLDKWLQKVQSDLVTRVPGDTDYPEDLLWGGDPIEIIINDEIPQEIPRPKESPVELKERLSKALEPLIRIS